MTKLVELNTLLSSSSLDLPQHRRSVDPSGRNLKWLRDNISKRNEVCERLTELLSLDITQLHESV